MSKRLWGWVLGVVAVAALLIFWFFSVQDDADYRLTDPAHPLPVEQVSDDEVNRVAKYLYCPVCENIPLDTCGTEACARWREDIRRMLAQGYSRNEIIEDFVVRYGDRVRAEPPPKGLHLLVYVLPPVLLVAGAFVLYRTVRAWMAASADVAAAEQTLAQAAADPAAPVAPDPEDDEYIRRLEEELNR